MVVDDDAANGRVLSIVLGRNGCDVQLAHDAEEALALAPTFHPDIVLLDLVLPRMSGLVLAETLRAMPELGEPVLIAATALDGDGIEEMALDAGCSAYIAKPIEWSALRDVIVAALGRGEGDA